MKTEALKFEEEEKLYEASRTHARELE